MAATFSDSFQLITRAETEFDDYLYDMEKLECEEPRNIQVSHFSRLTLLSEAF